MRSVVTIGRWPKLTTGSRHQALAAGSGAGRSEGVETTELSCDGDRKSAWAVAACRPSSKLDARVSDTRLREVANSGALRAATWCFAGVDSGSGARLELLCLLFNDGATLAGGGGSRLTRPCTQAERRLRRRARGGLSGEKLSEAPAVRKSRHGRSQPGGRMWN